MTFDPSLFVRMELVRNAGIVLDDPSPERTPDPEPDWDSIAVLVDRDLVRRILVERGAPARDLEWLTSSCPSLAAAQMFEPTPWMLRDFTDYFAT